MVNGQGRKAETAHYAIEAAYANEETDEFIIPTVLDNAVLIQSDDNVIFFNFRNDRSRQLTAVLSQDHFDDFDTGDYSGAQVTCLTEYDPEFLLPIGYAPERPQATVASVVSRAGYKQMHCAETEKYAHVTYFFNGGKKKPFAGEDHVMVHSPDVATYDLQPEMSAAGVADKVIEGLQSGDYGFIMVNFANGDMVGHTGNYEAARLAVNAVDKELGLIIEKAKEEAYAIVLTSDHGNCEEMCDLEGHTLTNHTVGEVWCFILAEGVNELKEGGGLNNIAPTVLTLMDKEIPKEMDEALI
jgi:2,3-bisphosphoglycerate-independent phosphoglycerate mutase